MTEFKQELFPGWLPIQLAHFYEFPLSYTGKGQSIAVISMGGPISDQDLKNSFHAMRVTAPNIAVVAVNKEQITSHQDQMPTLETQLDVQVLGSICPDARITVYRAPNPFGFSRAIDAAIKDRHSVISISWGGPEQSLDAHAEMEAVLKKAREQGITVCAAAGDSGSCDGLKDGLAHVDYPASSHHVLACGGTEMMLSKRKIKEVVWNNSDTEGGATGGGVSDLFPPPPWQSGFTIPSINTGKPGRIVPDVSAMAASGDYAIFQENEEMLIGGTSAVAPLWAALITLINEARAIKKKPPLGFINEHLYQLSAKHAIFNPVAEGNNRLADHQPGYDAHKGFNACCGLGTPMGGKLFKALLSL